MKILFLTAKFYPSVGGVEKHVLEISKRMVRKGHEVTIITENSPKGINIKKTNYQLVAGSDSASLKSEQPVKSSYSTHILFQKIKIYYFDFGEQNWTRKFRIWQRIFKEIDLLRQADVVHCHDVFFWYLPFKFLFPMKKVYTTFHGYESYPIKIRAVVIRKIAEMFSNGNICVGDFIRKWYKTKPDYVIYGGVNISKTFKSIKKPTALFYGRLDEQTGIKTYMKAFKLIKERIPDFKLDVFGDGKFKKQIKESKSFDPEIEKKIKNYRFVFVSRYLSMLEAMASKRMVFAVFDNPVKEDYLKMSPFAKFISISSSEAELASEVQFYYSNTNIEQKQLHSAYRWVKKQTWDEIVSIYEKLWRYKK